MARPTDYDFALAEEICLKVAEGKNIKTVLDSKSNYPSFPTWCKWKRENKELLNLYVNSIQDKGESVDAEIDSIMDLLKKGKIDPASANVLIQTLKWKAAKYYPKMFGDKGQLILTDEEGNNPLKGITVNVIRTLKDAG